MPKKPTKKQQAEVRANIKEFVKNNPGQLMKADGDWMAKETMTIADLTNVIITEITRDYGFTQFDMFFELPNIGGVKADYKVTDTGEYELLLRISPKKQPQDDSGIVVATETVQ